MTPVFDEKAIDAVFADLNQCHAPGAAIGIAIGGKPVYRKGFGLANMESPLVLTPSTRMRIASISKHFTCLAFLLLCEQGKARIDDPLIDYLPELKSIPANPTVRQVMEHTSGLRDAYDWFFYDPTARVSKSDILSFYSEVASVNAAPETDWRYNDGAYFLLGVAVERIAGQPLDKVFKDLIFDPIGMHDSMLRRWDDDFAPNSAALHTNDGQGGFHKVFRFNEGGGQGGIVSTVDDMLRWLAHMDSPFVGSAATWEVMKTARPLANGTFSDFGLSLINGSYRGVKTLWHSGGLLGTTSQLFKVPEAGLDIIVITNRRDAIATTLANGIVDACLLNLPPDQSSSNPACSIGTFHSPSTGRVIQLIDREGQQIASVDGADRIVAAADDGVLRTSSHIKYAIELIGDREKPASILFDDFGYRDELPAIGPSAEADAQAIVGSYKAQPAGFEAIIAESGQGLRLQLSSRFGSPVYDLECLGKGVWRAHPTSVITMGGVLSFAADARSFRLTTPATLAMPFDRVPAVEHQSLAK